MVVAVKRYHKIHLLDGIFLFNFFVNFDWILYHILILSQSQLQTC